MNRTFMIATLHVALFTSIIFFNCTMSAADTDVIFICNRSVPFDSITKAEIKKIFLGQKLNWTPDREITFVIMRKVDIHKQFTKKYTKKSPNQFRNYWRNMIFTGRGRAPT